MGNRVADIDKLMYHTIKKNIEYSNFYVIV